MIKTVQAEPKSNHVAKSVCQEITSQPPPELSRNKPIEKQDRLQQLAAILLIRGSTIRR